MSCVEGLMKLNHEQRKAVRDCVFGIDPDVIIKREFAFEGVKKAAGPYDSCYDTIAAYIAKLRAESWSTKENFSYEIKTLHQMVEWLKTQNEGFRAQDIQKIIRKLERE